MRRRRAAAAPLRNPPRPRPPPSSSAPPSASNPAPAPSCPRRTAPRHSAAPTDWGGGVATRALIGRRAAPPPLHLPPPHSPPPPSQALKAESAPSGTKSAWPHMGGPAPRCPAEMLPLNPFALLRLEPVGYFALQVLLPPLPPLPSAPPGQKKKGSNSAPNPRFPRLFFCQNPK